MEVKESLKLIEEQVSGITDPVLRKIAFEKLLDNLLNARQKGPRFTKESRRSKKTEEKVKSGTTKKGRPGPKEILGRLLEDGYFDSKRLVTDIPAHIKHKTGHAYSQGELSISLTRMLRQDLLTREKNNKGKYIWKKA